MAWQQCIEMSIEPFSVKLEGIHCWTWCLMDALWQWTKQQPMAGGPHCRVGSGDTPTHGITQNRRKEKEQWNKSLSAKKGLLSASQSRRVRLFDRSIALVRCFPGDNFWMKADGVAFGHIGQPLQDVVFSHCPTPSLYSWLRVKCDFLNFWQHSHARFTGRPANNPCSALFKLPPHGSQPPIHTNPLQLQSCSERDPTQKLEEAIRWWLFLLEFQALHEQKQQHFLLFC